MAYGDFKDLFKGTAYDKWLHDKAVNIEKNPQNMMGIKEVLLQWFSRFLLKSLETLLTEERALLLIQFLATKVVLQLLMHFKTFLAILVITHIEYGQIKVVSYEINQ